MLDVFHQVTPEWMSLGTGHSSIEEQAGKSTHENHRRPMLAGFLTQYDTVFATKRVTSPQTLSVDIGIDAAEMFKQQISTRIGSLYAFGIGPENSEKRRIVLGDKGIEIRIRP
ncbi:MAG: hypothetical protein ABIN69_06105 [Aestuariivirga sp.]